LEDKAQSLRGLTLRLYRLGESRRSKLGAAILDYPAEQRGLYREPNVYQFLLKLWGKTAVSTPLEVPMDQAAMIHDGVLTEQHLVDGAATGATSAEELAAHRARMQEMLLKMAATWKVNAGKAVAS
jgi:hypothetical protein